MDDSMAKNSDEGQTQPYPLPYYGSAGPYGSLGNGDDSGGFSLFDLWALFRRRWEIVIAVALLGTVLSYSYGVTRTPVYQATAALLIEPDNKIVDLDSVVEGLGSDSNAIATQINLLKSRGFLEAFAEVSYQDYQLSQLAEEALSLVKEGANSGPIHGVCCRRRGGAGPVKTGRFH